MPIITANQLAVGFFNIAAGGYTAEANANLLANEALAANSYINLPISFLNPQIAGGNLYSNDEFASGLVARFMPAASPGLAISLSKFVVNYMAANPTMGRGQVAIEMIKAVVAISPADVVLSAAAAPFKAKIALADASTSTSKDLAVLGVVVNGAAPAPVTTFNFTALAGETLTGTASDDIFNARILDNANTAQSGDKIDGGAGNDRMNLDIGNSQNFSITLESTGVEQVAVRAQAVGVDTSNNNISNGAALSKTNPGQISSTLDAQRMVGVTQWESNNSRGDVIIEDVRIASGNATKTVTIAMVETDPGNVDFGVYFNQLSLRNTSSGTGTLNVFLMDTAAANDPLTAATPLLNQNFNSYTFFNNGVRIVLGGTVANGASAGAAAAGVLIDNATTYAQLAAAFTEALKFANVGGSVSSTPAGNQVVVGGAVQDLSSAVTATLSAPQNLTTAAAASTTSASVAASFLNLTGQILILTASNSVAISNQTNTPGQAQGGWAAAGTAPSTGAIVQTFNSGSTTSGELVTSKIILDDVGMGSTGGDLVVGGMSVGETSDSRGVERFEIEVRDNSKLQTINGTNNALREVTIVNGVTDNVNRTTATSTTDSAYRTVTANSGDLTVNGNVNLTSQGTGTAAGAGSDTILKGVNSANTITGSNYAADHHGAFGFTDVRLIDASAMAGNLAFTAQITTDSIAKYITRVDTAANPAADVAGTGNVNFNVAGANFIYTGGAGNDTLAVTIDGNAAGSRSSIVSGQSDFTFNVAGGAGNDTITVNVVGGTQNQGGLQNWAANQDLNNNITISGGAGNDTIRTPGAGDVIIDGGDGNDTVYTDNTGRQTVADLNGSVGITTATTTTNGRWVFNTFDQVNAVANGAARNLNDLRSDANNSTNFYKGTVTVTFKDIPSKAITLANAVTYKATDLEINQAIKEAINLDPTLSKLLIAQDGPGNTLVVSSLIDGVMTTTDLTVAFAAAPATTVYSAAEISGMAIAYGSLALTTNALALAAQVLPSTARTDYATALAQDTTGLNIVGAASTSTSDNFITPGTGNDVIVLGTTLGVDAPRSSNEVITFAAGFGDDVIVNFAATGFGADHLNFAAFLTQGTPQTASAAAIPAAAVTVGALGNTDNLVTVVAQAATVNDTTALVTAIIKAAIDGAVQAAATKQIYVVVSASNVGTVYSVVNGTAVGDVVVTREGSIDLADTQWTTLTAASLTGVGAQAEGASSAPIAATLTAVVNNQVLVGTPGIDTLNNGGFVNITMTGLASGDTFNVTGGSATITDLATGDVVSRTGGIVTAGATNAVGVAAFVATSATTTNGVATNFIINSLTAGSTINMAAASVTAATFGYTLNGGTGVDNLTGSAGADAITTAGGADVVSAGAGADTINVSVSGIVSVAGGAGADTINVTGTATANVSDLFVGDIFTVAATSFLNATGITSFTASAATTNAAANTAVVLTSAAAGSTINMGAATGTTGYTITGGVGIDVLSGSGFADLINGGAGADTLTGNAGADTFTFANTATGTPTATNLDTITDYATTVDIIKGPGALTLVAEGSAAAAGQAAISATGLATFNAADTTLAQRLTAVEAGMTAATAVANEAAIFAVGADSYVFISDGTAGVGATDVLIKLTGIVAATGLVLTAGDITAAA